MAVATTSAVTALRRRRRRIDWASPLVYFIALASVGLTLVPILYVVLGGFRSNSQLIVNPAGLPSPWIFSNYQHVLTSSDFWTEVGNSAIAGLTTTAGVVLLGVMAAFAIARIPFRGRETLYTVFTLGLLFPLTVAVLPLYLLLQDIGLLGSLVGVIIPQIAFALPVTIIILVPFLRSIPVELEDAAAIDGTGRFGFFWRIMLPLSGPGLVTVGVLAFVASWNSFLLPLIVLSDPTSYTLPLGVANFSTEYSQDTASVLAFTALSMLPAMIFFTLAERRIVGGLQGAVKG
jgi:raffinose/stachyose/melibiose transport system permease protein